MKKVKINKRDIVFSKLNHMLGLSKKSERSIPDWIGIYKNHE